MKNNNKNFEWTEELIQKCLGNKNYQKLNIQDKHSETGFTYAFGNQPQLAEAMLEKDDIDFNIQDKWGHTVFMIACLFQPELAEVMLENDNIDFNIHNKWGDTGFMLSCVNRPELLKKMLENNQINKTLKDKNGLTGYDLAKRHNQESFNIYEAWLAEQEKNHIKSQVQGRSKKLGQYL